MDDEAQEDYTQTDLDKHFAELDLTQTIPLPLHDEPKLNRSYIELRKVILAHSESKVAADAFCEWEYGDMYEGPATSTCVCGKNPIVELNTVKHKVTGHILSPVGSVCIQHFGPEVVAEWRRARQVFLKTRKERIAQLKVGFGKYAHKTFLDVGRIDPSYAEWLLERPKYTRNPMNSTYDTDNSEICRLLRQGIDLHEANQYTLMQMGLVPSKNTKN